MERAFHSPPALCDAWLTGALCAGIDTTHLLKGNKDQDSCAEACMAATSSGVFCCSFLASANACWFTDGGTTTQPGFGQTMAAVAQLCGPQPPPSSPPPRVMNRVPPSSSPRRPAGTAAPAVARAFIAGFFLLWNGVVFGGFVAPWVLQVRADFDAVGRTQLSIQREHLRGDPSAPLPRPVSASCLVGNAAVALFILPFVAAGVLCPLGLGPVVTLVSYLGIVAAFWFRARGQADIDRWLERLKEPRAAVESVDAPPAPLPRARPPGRARPSDSSRRDRSPCWRHARGTQVPAGPVGTALASLDSAAAAAAVAVDHNAGSEGPPHGGDDPYECKICYVAPEGRVHQCTNGHYFCEACMAQVETCPTCRVALPATPIRCLVVEQILAERRRV